MTSFRYNTTAIGLHWLMACLLIGLFTIGLYMSDLPPSPWKSNIYAWHKWVGVTVFLLVLIRIAWRFIQQPPLLPNSISKSRQLVAHVGHALLYVLMVAIPVSGWLMSSAKGFQTVWFGILPIPDLLDKNQALFEQLQEVHENLNYALAALVFAHAAAAIKHHLHDKDDVLRRMLPWRMH